MKIEKRGKYPGVKVHLEPDECEAFMAFTKDVEAAKASILIPVTHPTLNYFTISAKIGKKLTVLMEEDPKLLAERTQDEILASMQKDLDKIVEQKAAIAAHHNWKDVK